jgi:4-hydroxy 2-oxovalerate aldolase
MKFNFNSPENSPIVLDVTIRDGGYLNQWHFTWEQMMLAFESAFACGADIVEIGYLDDRQSLPIAASWPARDLEKLQVLHSRGRLAAMCRPSVIDAENVLGSRKDLVDLIRIPVDLKNPQLANKLATICGRIDLPYSFNLTNISCFSPEQIRNAFSALSDDATAVYIADSRGALFPEQVGPIFDTLAEVRQSSFGYHAHDNLELAAENTRAALQWGVSWIDGSLLGIGLGGRNLRLDDALELAQPYRKDLQYKKLDAALSEADFGVPAPGTEMPMYSLTGKKNFKMEWAMMMATQLGQDVTCEIIDSLPEKILFFPEELKPFVTNEQWNQLIW